MSSPLLVHRLPDGVSEEFERSCETMGRSGSRRNFARWLAAGWLQSYLIFLLTNMGNLWAPRPTVGRYFLSETGCKLGNLHRVHGSRKLFTCSYLFDVDGESERIEFFFLELFYLWRDRWRGECFLGNSAWLEFLLTFILLVSFKFSENF